MITLHSIEEVTPARILYFDIETTDMELRVRTYGLKNYTRYFNHKDIVRDWSILSFAYMFEGEAHPKCVSVSHKDVFNDELVVYRLHEVLSEADVIIGHNSDNFDIKKFNARAIILGLPPIEPKKYIDTLKIARKYFKFSSNTLSYIAKTLGVSEKDDSPDWKAIMDGCPEALREMRDYNRQDVVVGRDVYKKLMPYHHTHPDMNILNPIRDTAGDLVETCPKCQSPDTSKRGFQKYANGRKKQRHQCNSCGGWWTSRKFIK